MRGRTKQIQLREPSSLCPPAPYRSLRVRKETAIGIHTQLNCESSSGQHSTLACALEFTWEWWHYLKFVSAWPWLSHRVEHFCGLTNASVHFESTSSLACTTHLSFINLAAYAREVMNWTLQQQAWNASVVSPFKCNHPVHLSMQGHHNGRQSSTNPCLSIDCSVCQGMERSDGYRKIVPRKLQGSSS